MSVFTFKFRVEPGIGGELHIKARTVVETGPAQVVRKGDAIDRDLLVAHELVVHTALEIGLEVAVFGQIPLFAQHQTGATGQGAGIVLLHLHAVAGREVHAFHPVPGELELGLDEASVAEAEHAPHFLADAAGIGMVGTVHPGAVQHAGLEVLVIPVPGQHGVGVPAVRMLLDSVVKFKSML